MKNRMKLLLGITSLCIALSGCSSTNTNVGAEAISPVEEGVSESVSPVEEGVSESVSAEEEPIAQEVQNTEQETVEGDIQTSENETTDNKTAENETTDNETVEKETTEKETTEEVLDSVSEASLKEKLSANVTLAEGQEILMLYEDFDENGEYEAFAFVGTSPVEGDDMSAYEGAVWYVDSDECRCIESAMSYINVLKCIDFGKKKYICFDRFYVTESPTDIYTVKNGTAIEGEYSGMGHVYGVNGTHFTITQSAYDVTYDATISAMIGHSWKPYYFYYDSISDSICEIEAHEISAEEAKGLMPEGAFDEIAALNGTVTTCILRFNGMLNVNYEIQSEDGSIKYCNANYDTIDNCYQDAYADGNATLEGSNFGGTYQINL